MHVRKVGLILRRLRIREGEQRGARSSAARVSIIYAVVGVLWIFFSDSIIEFLTPSTESALRIQTFKGWFFILITAILLFYLINRYFSELQYSIQRTYHIEKRYQLALDGSEASVWDLNPKSGELIVSDSFKTMLGYDHDADFNHIGKVKAIIHPDDQRKVEKAFSDHVEGNTDHYIVEARLRCSDNSYKWILTRGKVVDTDEDGNAIRALGLDTDITKIKEISEKVSLQEVALHEADEITKSIFDASPDGIALVNDEGVIIFVSSGMQKLFGLEDEDDMLGTTFDEWIAPENKELANKRVKKILDGAKYKSNRYILSRKDGSTFYGEINSGVIRDVKGKVIQMVSIIRDVSEKVRYETELDLAKKAAESSSKVKSSLLSNMSHELRTPMNGILGFSSMILSSAEDGTIKTYAEKIEVAGERLMNTLNSVMELAQLEDPDFRMNTKSVNLKETVEIVVRKFSKKHQYAEISVSNKTSGDVYVSGDERFIDRAIAHCLDNAVKFSNGQQLEVEISTDFKDGKRYGIVNIADNGIGMTQEEVETIFEAFKQGSEGMGRAFEGTGLGLTITKRIMDQQNGIITVSSELDKGTNVVLGLPLIETEDESKKKQEHLTERKMPEDQKKPRVLYVEDNDLNREVTKLYLEGYCEVETAENSDTAIAMTESGSYDLILMDINLGKGMNGIELTKLLRQKETYTETPIIAVTGYALYGDAEEFIKQGFDSYLSKPFNQSQLKRIIASYKPEGE